MNPTELGMVSQSQEKFSWEISEWVKPSFPELSVLQIRPRSFLTFVVFFCLLLPQHDQTTITKTTAAAATTATTLQASALRYTVYVLLLDHFGIVASKWIKHMQVCFSFSVHYQQMSSKPPDVWWWSTVCSTVQTTACRAIGRPRSTMQTLHETSRERYFSSLDCQSLLFWLWFPSFFLQTSHTLPIDNSINVWMSSDSYIV